MLQSFQGKAKTMFIARCIMGNVKMANITINNATMLLRLLFSTAKHMSAQGIIFNYDYEPSRGCTRYHRRSWNSIWAKLLTANWKRQSLTRSLCYIFWSHRPKKVTSSLVVRNARQLIKVFDISFVMLFPSVLKHRQDRKLIQLKFI